MKFKQFVVAGAVSLAFSGAWAVDRDVMLEDGSAFFGGMHFVDGAFTDTFTFTGAPAMSNGSASLITIALSPGVQDISFTSANLNGLYDFTPLVTGMPGLDVSTLTFTNVSSPLIITVMGTATGTGSGTSASYSGTFNVTAVPEPETYALMLAGLGAIGFMARRRRGA